jgi:hypothetical protein
MRVVTEPCLYESLVLQLGGVGFGINRAVDGVRLRVVACLDDYSWDWLLLTWRMRCGPLLLSW